MIAPPLLVSFTSLDDYLSALSPELKEEFGQEIRDLHSKRFPLVVSSRCLSVLFGFSTKFINAMRLGNERYYREFTIRQGRKKRKIQAPKVALKVIQKWFSHHLSQVLPVEDYVFGFVPGRSAVDAAARHCGAQWVYSIDIKDFFTSTDADTVRQALLNLGYSAKGCDLMVPLCCFGDNLAQGAPSSPVLSNLVMKDVDSRLKEISETHGVTFTRYADDIVFSNSGTFPDEIKALVSEVFNATCWTLSDKKCRLAEVAKGQRLKVHGLLVHGDKPRLTKGYRNRIRAYEHLLNAGKIHPNDEPRIRGHIKYAKSVGDY